MICETQRNQRQVKGLAQHRHAVQWRVMPTENPNTASYADQSNHCLAASKEGGNAMTKRKKIPGALEAKLLVESRNTCNICWRSKEVEIHHIVPVELGGGTMPKQT